MKRIVRFFFHCLANFLPFIAFIQWVSFWCSLFDSLDAWKLQNRTREREKNNVPLEIMLELQTMISAGKRRWIWFCSVDRTIYTFFFIHLLHCSRLHQHQHSTKIATSCTNRKHLQLKVKNFLTKWFPARRKLLQFILHFEHTTKCKEHKERANEKQKSAKSIKWVYKKKVYTSSTLPHWLYII